MSIRMPTVQWRTLHSIEMRYRNRRGQGNGGPVTINKEAGHAQHGNPILQGI